MPSTVRLMDHTDRLDDTPLLAEIDGPAADLFNRHLDSARTWSPHEQVDWGSGQSFATTPWAPEQYPLPEGVRSSIHVNLLTEDNLPYYTEEILSHAPSGHPLREWTQFWTMEENRHSTVMRDWVHLSRCIDPVALEEARRAQMSTAAAPHFSSLSEMIAYVALQERATQIAHRNTAARLPKEDKVGRNVLALIAGDETKHHIFYRDLVTSALQIDPSTMVQAISRRVRDFNMPGVGIPNFVRHAVRIAREGIYGLPQFLNDVVKPALETWRIEELTALSDTAERAREELRTAVAQLSAQVARLAEKAAPASPAL